MMKDTKRFDLKKKDYNNEHEKERERMMLQKLQNVDADMCEIDRAQGSLVEEGEGSYLPNCQTNLVIALCTLSLLFSKFINTTAYHLGRYEPSYPHMDI